ncbi:MAG: NAD-dependent epimerase/dehydratase family protein [Acidobacteriia bacterium]|nr:NAD-dependent epimerase/dehydratase family protein [Terriglobia bacterium]
MKILISGGAGFIGTHVARRLLDNGYEVTVLDNFSEQIHGKDRELAPDLRGEVRLVVGDVRDEDAWRKALLGQEVVLHLAAETGTGQSMYRVRHYTDVNIAGTSTLVELLLAGNTQVQSLIVASSRAVYGEGAYKCGEHGTVYPAGRVVADMKKGEYEPKCPVCSLACLTIPTTEEAPFRPSSLYGLTKQVQEQMALLYAHTLGINGFALRCQNVFGPGQSLKNPYTGILAIFSNQARANEPIYIFEDGKESRDFVYIDDVVEATVRCVEAKPQPPAALNIGSGRSVSVQQVAEAIVRHFNSKSEVIVNGAFREGDIRHNTADLSRAKNVLGFSPAWKFADGLQEFLMWSERQDAGTALYEHSLAEMREKGLMHGK